MTITNQESKKINVPGRRRKHSRKAVKHILKKKNLLQSNINKKSGTGSEVCDYK